MAPPKHVAIIMDGNGRWAQRRGHPRVFGHVRGSSRVKVIAKAADELGIKALTLYAFSTENWTRPDGELSVLWKLLKKFLIREQDEMNRNNVCLRVIGEIDRLRSDVREVIDGAVNKLAKNTGLQLTFCVSYGSRKELLRATKQFAKDCLEGRHKPEDMTEDLMRDYLWTSELKELSDVDLVIRTSGEMRVSNYLLWQAAYAEYYFTDICWPDFTPENLKQAIESFSKRERRFGGLLK